MWVIPVSDHGYTHLKHTITSNTVDGQKLCLALWESKKGRKNDLLSSRQCTHALTMLNLSFLVVADNLAMTVLCV